MYRKISANQSAITLRPPPGTRFSIFGQDVELQYADAQQEELFDWLDNWMKCYVKPLARRAAIPVPVETKPALEEPEANSEITKADGQERTETQVSSAPESLPTPNELKELTGLLDELVKTEGMSEAIRRLRENTKPQSESNETKGE